MATISKRNDTYRIRVSCGYDVTGKQIVKSMTWRPDREYTPKQLEKELNRVATEFEAKVTSGYYADGDLKFVTFCTQYMELAQTSLEPLTRHFYQSVIDRILIPMFGNMKLTEIKPIHSQQLINYLQSPKVRVDGKDDHLSPATVKRYFTVFQSIMSRAYKLELIERNPSETTKLDMPTVEEPEVEIFDQEEAKHLLDCLSDEKLELQVLINLAIVTGCRRGELVALQWSMVDFAKGKIKVSRSSYKVAGEAQASKTTKTKRSRELSIPPYMIDLLRAYRKEQLRRRLLLGDQWVEGDWIFTRDNGDQMSPYTPTRQFDRFLKRHGIDHRKFHALRHTSATLLLASGTPIKNVSARLGHTQLSTTNRYVHALEDADREAANTFEALATQDDKEESEIS